MRSLRAMGGTIVDDPEHPASGAVGLLLHDLGNKAVERSEQVLPSHRPDSLAR
jgi:hypothetical protein